MILKLGYLTQNVYFFNDTLKDNLTLGEKINEKIFENFRML